MTPIRVWGTRPTSRNPMVILPRRERKKLCGGVARDGLPPLESLVMGASYDPCSRIGGWTGRAARSPAGAGVVRCRMAVNAGGEAGGFKLGSPIGPLGKGRLQHGVREA